MDKIIEEYNSLDISAFRESISNLKPDDMKKLKNDFDNRYYNTGEDTIEDLKYDIFIEVLYEKDPLFNLNIGCKLRDCDNKTRLPIYIGGMDKIKKGELRKLEDWKNKNQTESYMLSDKLNGVSCLIKLVGTTALFKTASLGSGKLSFLFFLKYKNVKPPTATTKTPINKFLFSITNELPFYFFQSF